MPRSLYTAKIKCITLTAVSATAALFTGCSGFTAAAPTPSPIGGPIFQGSFHGGQQPIAGANVALYAAGTAGYGSASMNLLTSPVTTTAAGNFTLTGHYTCTPGQQLYLVGTGGNPGAGNNPNVALMAAIGDCSNLTSSTFINVNEITTIGSIFALAPFMTSFAGLGTSPTNTAGLTHAFASVNKLVNVATGSGVGSALPAGATGPTDEILMLANIIAGCINSTGVIAGKTTPCGTLFSLTTPPGGSTPADTIQAALNIAHNPTLNVTALFNSAPAASPYASALYPAPADWTLAITYKTGGFSAPASTTVDASGRVWVANGANNSVTVLTQGGTPAANSPFGGNGLAGPASVAIDAQGNAWIANKGSNSVSVFTPTGVAFGASPFTGNSTLSAPTNIAIDAPGNIWIANSGNNSVTELGPSGSYLRQATSGVSGPTGLAINPK